MKIDRTRPFSFYIDLPVRNEWSNIELLRTSVQNCFAAVFADVDGCHAISMVTGELLENAMKYGAWADREHPISFRLRVQGDETGTTVSVQNPVLPGESGVRDLEETLDWIRTFPSAKEAYKARLLEIANTGDEDAASRLGLVRVAYEGDCTLSATVEDGVLTVVANLRP